MGRAYCCWMLNCWCITWPVGFKRLIYITHSYAWIEVSAVAQMRFITLLGYYAVYIGSLLPTFRDNLSSHFQVSSSLDCLALADGTDRLSWNVGKHLPMYAEWHPKRARFFKLSKKIVWTLKMGAIGCPKTSITNYQSTLRNIPKVLIFPRIPKRFIDCRRWERQVVPKRR